jgi:hypothetical protein
MSVRFIARQFRSVPTVTSPRYRADTSSGVRNLASDISILHHFPAQHVTDELVAMLTPEMTEENDIFNEAA